MTAMKLNAQSWRFGIMNTGSTHTKTRIQCGTSMSFAEAIRARQTAEHGPRTEVKNRVLAVSSSELLMHFAHALWYGRIQSPQPTLPGLGSGFDVNWSKLVTLACPSDSEAAAVGRTRDASECSCSVHWATPKASDWKGGTAKQRTDGGNREEFKHQWTRRTGYTYPDPEVIEAVLTFPVGWTALEPLGTLSVRASVSGSADE